MRDVYDQLHAQISKTRQQSLLEYARQRTRTGGTQSENECLQALQSGDPFTLLDALVVAYVMNGGVMLCTHPEEDPLTPGVATQSLPLEYDSLSSRGEESPVQGLSESETDSDSDTRRADSPGGRTEPEPAALTTTPSETDEFSATERDLASLISELDSAML